MPNTLHAFPLQIMAANEQLRELIARLREMLEKQNRANDSAGEPDPPDYTEAMKAWDRGALWRLLNIGVGGPQGDSGSSGAGGPVGNDSTQWQTTPWWQR